MRKSIIGMAAALAALCSMALSASAEDSLFTVECTGYQETNSDSEVWAT